MTYRQDDGIQGLFTERIDVKENVLTITLKKGIHDLLVSEEHNQMGLHMSP